MLPQNTQAHIKVNKLIEASGWRLSDEGGSRMSVQLEPDVKIADCGDDFEAVKDGFVDYLLFADKGFPLAVLEGKRADKNPFDGKEQASKYAKSQAVQFVILSNGDGHYLWDFERGNTAAITMFPSQASLQQGLGFNPDNRCLSTEVVGADYITLCQNPRFKGEPLFQGEATRGDYLKQQGLRVLRPYQVDAIATLQQPANAGNDSFLFEIATHRNQIEQIKIPLPPPAIQNQAMAEIVAEQTTIDECKKLITKMQQKITDKISEAWQ